VTTDEKTHLSGRSWVPAALAWGALVVGFWIGRDSRGAVADMEKALSDGMAKASKDFELVKDDVADIKRDVASLTRASNDSVSRAQFELFCLRLALANPQIKMVDAPWQ
jgi:hypothetical protein